MISSGPEVDADELDDDQLLEAYFSIDAPHPAQGSASSAVLPDWPVARVRDVGLTLERETLMWFQARHADWREEMRFVLRAWTIARSKAETIGPSSR